MKAYGGSEEFIASQTGRFTPEQETAVAVSWTGDGPIASVGLEASRLYL